LRSAPLFDPVRHKLQCSALDGQEFTHLPQRIHSAESVFDAFIGHISEQRLQPLQAVLSVRIFTIDTRFNSEYNAPSGHKNRQNGRKILIEVSKTNAKTAIFQTNNKPTAPRIREFTVTSGIPASRVPTGQINS